jgi:hypothetical protein
MDLVVRSNNFNIVPFNKPIFNSGECLHFNNIIIYYTSGIIEDKQNIYSFYKIKIKNKKKIKNLIKKLIFQKIILIYLNLIIIRIDNNYLILNNKTILNKYIIFRNKSIITKNCYRYYSSSSSSLSLKNDNDLGVKRLTRDEVEKGNFDSYYH